MLRVLGDVKSKVARSAASVGHDHRGGTIVLNRDSRG